jgi:hypothetical protein
MSQSVAESAAVGTFKLLLRCTMNVLFLNEDRALGIRNEEANLSLTNASSL